VLAAFGLAGGAAGVHEEEWGFGVERNGFDDLAAIVFQNIFDEIIAFADHRCFRHLFAGITTPNQNFVDVVAFFLCGLHGDIGVAFVVDPLSIAIVAVGVNKDATAGIGGAEAAGLAAESSEDDGMNNAEAGASEHGDGKLGNHRHVNGDAVAGFEAAEIAEHGRGFVYANVKLAIGEDLRGFVFGFGDEDEGGFVFVLGEMAVNAVVGGVEFAADEPFPERRVGGVEGFRPLFVPVEKIGVVVEALWEVFFGEFFDKGGVGEIGLGFEFLRRMEIFLFLPVDGDLCFGGFFRARCFGSGGARVRFCLGHERILRGEILAAVGSERESRKGKKCGFAVGAVRTRSVFRGSAVLWAVKPESCIARILLAGRSLTPTSSLGRFERYVKFLLL